MENYYLMAISGLLPIIFYLLTVLWSVNSRDRKIIHNYEREKSERQKQHTQEITEMTKIHTDEKTELIKEITQLKRKNKELSEQINKLQSQQEHESPPKENSGNSWMSNSLKNLK